MSVYTLYVQVNFGAFRASEELSFTWYHLVWDFHEAGSPIFLFLYFGLATAWLGIDWSSTSLRTVHSNAMNPVRHVSVLYRLIHGFFAARSCSAKFTLG